MPSGGGGAFSLVQTPRQMNWWRWRRPSAVRERTRLKRLQGAGLPVCQVCDQSVFIIAVWLCAMWSCDLLRRPEDGAVLHCGLSLVMILLILFHGSVLCVHLVPWPVLLLLQKPFAWTLATSMCYRDKADLDWFWWCLQSRLKVRGGQSCEEQRKECMKEGEQHWTNGHSTE